MKLYELIVETEILELTQILFEETSHLNEQNNIVKSWAEKLGMTYDKLHLIWDKAKKDVEDKTNYRDIVGNFKKKLTSLKGVTKKQLEKDGKATFNYKVRTQQTIGELLDDEPAPKKRNKEYVKSIKSKIEKINRQIKEVESSSNNTEKRRERNEEKVKDLKNRKKELNNSLK